MKNATPRPAISFTKNVCKRFILLLASQKSIELFGTHVVLTERLFCEDEFVVAYGVLSCRMILPGQQLRQSCSFFLALKRM